MKKVKIFLTITVDPEEYPVPSDGDVTYEFEESLRDFFYDIQGTKINSIKIIME
jgi:hypothetical protein